MRHFFFGGVAVEEERAVPRSFMSDSMVYPPSRSISVEWVRSGRSSAVRLRPVRRFMVELLRRSILAGRLLYHAAAAAVVHHYHHQHD